MHILFLLFFVLINYSTISGKIRIHFTSLRMVPPAGNEFFDPFFSDLAVLPILPETVSSKSLSNLNFIIESILANYTKNFLPRKDSCKCFTEIAFSTKAYLSNKHMQYHRIPRRHTDSHKCNISAKCSGTKNNNVHFIIYFWYHWFSGSEILKC